MTPKLLAVSVPLVTFAFGACGEPTAPQPSHMRPDFSAAVERSIINGTSTLREQNPCNGDPVDFTIRYVLTFQGVTTPGGPDGFHYTIREHRTGVGDSGTSYRGVEHVHVVFRSTADGLSIVSSGISLVIHSKPAGGSFLQVARYVIDRKTDEIRVQGIGRKCLDS